MKLPSWLRQSEPERATYQCPFCKTDWLYLGPLNPCRWQCPICNTILTWQGTEQLEPYRVRVCRTCGGGMEERGGRNGTFWGCDFWPDCNGTGWRWEWRLRPIVKVEIIANYA